MATIRLINSGVFDRHPNLTVHMAHLSGGIASMLGAHPQLPGQGFLGHQGQCPPRHQAAKDFDYYLNNNMVFDTAGFAGAISSVKTALVEIPAVAHRVRDRLSAGDPRARGGARLRARHPRARQGRRGDPVGQCREAAEDEGSALTPSVRAARCFSISCTGILTKSLSISARSPCADRGNRPGAARRARAAAPHDDDLALPALHLRVEMAGERLQEALLLLGVPIGLLHGAAPVADRIEGPAGRVGSQLAGLWSGCS